MNGSECQIFKVDIRKAVSDCAHVRGMWLCEHNTFADSQECRENIHSSSESGSL